MKTELKVTCKKCGGAMAPGKAMQQTWTGSLDFPDEKHYVTISPGGSGKLIECMKCKGCGWSMTL